jgi:DNA-directed RNA polymerase subunit M/transcription elongation factor TFIIS
MLKFLKICAPCLPADYTEQLLLLCTSQCIFQDVAYYVNNNKTAYIDHSPTDIVRLSKVKNDTVAKYHVESNIETYNALIAMDIYKDVIGDSVNVPIPVLFCRKCGHDEVTWHTKQTRSADEGSTVFCTCSRCFNRWKM